MRLAVLFPLACSIVAFVLGFLALFAGQKPGFMEDYAILRINASEFGHNVKLPKLDVALNIPDIPTPTLPSIASLTSDVTGVLSVIASATAAVGGDINNITNGIADSLAKELGIQEWYSLHLMDACEGNFIPGPTNATGYNVTLCSKPSPGYKFNLSGLLDDELKIGPLKIGLSAFNFPSQIQTEINHLNDLLEAVFVLYVLGIAFSGLAMLFCLGAICTGAGKAASLGNLAVAVLGAASFGIGAVITTVGAKEGSDEINKYGQDVSVFANAGDKFIGASWAAFGTMALSAVFWVVEGFAAWRGRRRARRDLGEKAGART